jgi:hypothetical protein
VPVLACSLALAGCGGGERSSPPSSAPEPPRPAAPALTREQVEECLNQHGAETREFNVPALRPEHDLVQRRGGSAFASEISLRRSGAAIAFFVYPSAAEARAGATRVRGIIERYGDVGQRGTVLVGRNVVGATFLDVPPAAQRDIRRCTS